MSTEAIPEAQFVREFTLELHNNNAAAFIGAGFSMSSGYVDWKGLLADIVKDLGLDPDKEHDLVSVAQYSVNKLAGNKAGLTRTIVHKVGEEKNPTHSHAILASLPIHTYWTTNYDKLIETSLRNAHKVPDVKYTVPQLAVTRLNRDVVVYKMHGDIDHANEAVICKDDYEKYPFKMNAFASALRGDLIEKTFLFVGFSFTDPNIDFILSRVRAMLEKDQREHYCIQKKVTRLSKETSKDFQYRQLKQDYFIRDLKRFNILTILVDDYGDIPLLLEKVATRYKRSSVFISGAVAEYGTWTEPQAEEFLRDLSHSLAEKRNRVITGFGLGVGGPVINGTLDYLNHAGIPISDEHIVMRPFPHTSAGRKVATSKWTEYRQSMIAHAGIAVFVFGNKRDASGKPIESSGMREEFDLCINAGVVPLPIGATGYMANTLWKDVHANFSIFFPNANSAFRKQFAVIGDKSKRPAEILASVVALIELLQKD